MSNEPYSETQAIIELGKLDYERHKQADQRCLDAGGCPECLCVATEQGREHWGHCSKACQVLVDLGEHCGKPITSVVEEPWTPGRFQIQCCDGCARNFLSEGYHDKGKVA